MNDLNFMPVYEIKSLKMPDNEETFDIFLDGVDDSEKYKTNPWDSSMPINYEKLQKYISF